MLWFRMYHEFATDPKVQMLSEVDQRRFVMLLCLKSCNGDVTLQDEEVAFQLRISNDEWSRTKDLLVSKGLLETDNTPTNWDKRQYVSDSSSERVARYRAKSKQECNVTVTAPDTDTDTDTEAEKETETETEKAQAPIVVDVDSSSDGFNAFWELYGRKGSKQQALAQWQRLKCSKAIPQVMEGLTRYLGCKRVRNGYKQDAFRWLREKGWQSEWEGARVNPETPTDQVPF